jgi:hypothetical protein
MLVYTLLYGVLYHASPVYSRQASPFRRANKPGTVAGSRITKHAVPFGKAGKLESWKGWEEMNQLDERFLLCCTVSSLTLECEVVNPLYYPVLSGVRST